MVTSYSFHKITKAYDDHCILDANVSFIAKSSEEATAYSWAIASASSYSTDLSDEPEYNPYGILLKKYPNLNETERSFLETREYIFGSFKKLFNLFEESSKKYFLI
jgi:hypothetical protein